MLNRIWSQMGIVILALFILAPANVRSAEGDNLTPAHVYQNVGTLMNEIEQIRLTMGKRLPREREFRLDDVEPRQVFFQAQTLFRKCNVLAQEVAGISRQTPPAAPEGRAIADADIFDLVEGARVQLQHVRSTLGITEHAQVPRFNTRRSAADVMHDIIEAGYILNSLTAQTVDWSQIYDRVYQAITYVGGALPEENRFPALDSFACCKVPQDVFARLALTMEASRPVAKKVDLDIIRITTVKQAEGGASPETVYDLTTTLVSDFGELTLRLEGEDVAGPDYPRPARILPSHVFQLAGALEKQVEMLNAL